MPKKIEETLYILSPYRGYITAAKLMGPIAHPLKVTKSIAVQILMSGAKVYEYIPATRETFELTLSNINNPNRYDTVKKSVTASPVEPVKRAGIPNITDNTVDDVTPPSQEEVTDETVVNPVENSEPATKVEETVEDTESSDNNKASVVDTIEFSYNEDGTIDESTINWNSYSKNERKAIRAHINQHNTSVSNNQ